MYPITVIGIGEDGLDGLSASARTVLAAADVIAGGARHLGMLGADDSREQLIWEKGLDPTVGTLDEKRQTQRVVVLATGDPLLHGIGAKLIARLGAAAVEVIPSPSAFSLAAARLGWSLSDLMVRTVSVHALPFDGLRRWVQPGVRLLILSRDGSTPAAVAEALSAMGYGPSQMTVLERIGGDAEARRDTTAADGFTDVFANLNTIAVTCVAAPGTRPLSAVPGLPEDAFAHDGVITKREVRAVTLAALGPLPGETLWDIGAGSGTVAIEWMRAEPAARAVAFERDSGRLAHIRANAAALGVPGLEVVEGAFPATIMDRGAPDALFVGGGIAGDEEMLAACLRALRPGGRLVANAVTLVAQGRLIEAHASHGGELVRIGIAQASPVGGLQALKSAIDVIQWRVTKA